MPLVPGPEGPIECFFSGRGDPVTVFAHGLAGSIDETRPFGSGVRGTRVFFHFRGHGATVGSAAPWTYDAAAAELRAVITAYAATRALGVSLGAGAVLRAAAVDGVRFERIVIVLPASIDLPRTDPAIERMQHHAELVEHRDLDGLACALVAEQPADLRERADVRGWAHRQAVRLTSTTVARALRELPPLHPLESRDRLAEIACPALVIGQDDDAAHPAAVARDLAQLLPSAQLRVFAGGGLVWRHRAELRALISTFLNI